MWVQSLGWDDPLEKGWYPTPVLLPGKSLWTEELGELQPMELQSQLQLKRLSVLTSKKRKCV